MHLPSLDRAKDILFLSHLFMSLHWPVFGKIMDKSVASCFVYTFCVNVVNIVMSRYLNTQYVQKQKVNEADISYGGFSVELSEQMYEIGEVRTP